MRAATLILLALSVDVLRSDMQYDRARPHRRRRTSVCTTNLNYGKVFLKQATLNSKYVFTGKVHLVSSVNDKRLYKVNIRRVLKGDLNDIHVGVSLKFGTAESLRFSGATVLVYSAKKLKCPPLRVRSYAIFLTERNRGEFSTVLNLVVEPVSLSLRNIDIIEAAIKGKLLTVCCLFLLLGFEVKPSLSFPESFAIH